MTSDVLNSLALPPDTRVDQRVSKKHLVQNGAPTSANKRQINDGIEEMIWLAALKPTNIGVPAFRDEAREYLEIAVLSAVLRPPAKTSRIIELVHRAIPYPVLLLTTLAETVTLSVAHKRWSQGEAGRVVLDDQVSTAVLSGTADEFPFLAALSLSALPQQNLHALYQGWLAAIAALAAARLTGSFVVAETPEATSVRRAALDDYARIQREIAGIRLSAKTERQIHRRVELNLAIQKLEAQLAKIAANL